VPELRIGLTVIGLAVVVLAAGCSDNGGGGTDTNNPAVVATYPQAGAVDINLNPLIQVWFDQRMDEATLDSASCHVAGAVTDRLEYDGAEKAVQLYLRELLAPETEYEIILSSTVTNEAGDPLTGDTSFAFTTGPMDCEHLEDYLEPNNTIDEPADVELVTAYPLLSSCSSDDEDYFRFDLLDTALVTARIENVYSEDAQPMFHIRFKRATDESYTWFTGWFEEGGSLNHRFTFLPGTYYLYTYNTSGEDRAVVYNLILQLSAPCMDDSLEDNDFIDEASPIGAGLTEGLRGCYRDRDCYSIHLETGQILAVTLDQDPDIGSQLVLEILGPAGSTLAGGIYHENPAVLSWAATQDTTHYIAATYWDNNVTYTIETDVMSTP